jgi:hypothetical protein
VGNTASHSILLHSSIYEDSFGQHHIDGISGVLRKDTLERAFRGITGYPWRDSGAPTEQNSRIPFEFVFARHDIWPPLPWRRRS